MNWKVFNGIVSVVAVLITLSVFVVSTSGDSQAMAIAIENRVTIIETTLVRYESIEDRMRRLETADAVSIQVMGNLKGELIRLSNATNELVKLIPEVAVLKSHIDRGRVKGNSG